MITEKQASQLHKIVSHFGEEHVQSYIWHFYPDAVLSDLTKEQAQKIITGLGAKLPRKPITGIIIPKGGW